MLADFIARFTAAYIVDKAGASQQVDFRDHLGDSLLTGETTPVMVAPTITTQPSITGGTTTGSVLTLNEGAASGTSAPTGAIQWLRRTTAISGATGATYTLVSGDVGQAISARVTWTNSAGSVQATSNAITGQAPAATPAPAATTAPSINPASATVGDSVTLTLGIWSNASSVSGVLMQGGVDRTSEIVDQVWSPGVSGAYTWTVTATGPGGTTTHPAINGTVGATAPAGPDAANYLLYADNDTPQTVVTEADTAISPNGTRVTAVQSEGTLGIPLAQSATNTNVVMDHATGWDFQVGKYLTSGAVNIPIEDGLIALAEFTVEGTGGTQRILDLIGLGALRIATATMQSYVPSATNGGAGNLNYAAGTAVVGTKYLLALELDRVNQRVRYRDAVTGEIKSVAASLADTLAVTEIQVGGSSSAIIHKIGLRRRTSATTLEESIADFLAGA